jgi:hypothetical protein
VDRKKYASQYDPERPLVDAIITCSATCLEEKALKTLSENAKIVNLGCAIGPVAFEDGGERARCTTEIDTGVEAFLKWQATRSVFLISFG